MDARVSSTCVSHERYRAAKGLRQLAGNSDAIPSRVADRFPRSGNANLLLTWEPICGTNPTNPLQSRPIPASQLGLPLPCHDPLVYPESMSLTYTRGRFARRRLISTSLCDRLSFFPSSNNVAFVAA
ncbi:hypothetical protein MTO96_009915 [Rhipicephalus appendiculatus]